MEAGLHNTKFKMTLTQNTWDLIQEPVTLQVEVTSKPVRRYHQWYYKILEKLTFGKFFNERWEHTVKFL